MFQLYNFLWFDVNLHVFIKMLNKTNFEDAIRVLSNIFIALLLVSENTLQVNCQSLLNEKNSSQNAGYLRKLIFTEGNRINAIDPNGENLIELAALAPWSFVFSCERKMLYWIEVDTKIRAVDVFKPQSSSVIFDDDSSELNGLALDFINDKLYIGNDASLAIEVVDLKNGIRGIIPIPGDIMSAILDIAVDPEEGYLFILGYSELIRTDLDGLNLHYIIEGSLEKGAIGESKKSMNHPDSIVLDTIEKRIYWVDEFDGTTCISSSTYSGTNKKMHLQYEVDTSHEANFIRCRLPLAFISNTPYWIDKVHGVINRIDLSNPNYSKTIYHGTAENMSLSSIASIDCKLSHYRQKTTNPCKKKNGGCQHLCILSRSSESNYRCFCKIGYELSEDGKSCILPTKYIMFVKNGRVRGVNWRKDIKQYVEVLGPSNTANFLLELDINEGMIFSHGSESLYRKNLSKKKKFILNPDVLTTEVTEIVFDWASKNLYYTSKYCPFNNTLSVLNTKNSTYSKILAVAAETNSFGSGLAVHPNKGYVYFVETIQGLYYSSFSSLTSNVTRIYTDGSNSTTVLKMRKEITCITIDFNEDKLYWSEFQIRNNFYYENSILYYSNLDGKEITKVSVLKYPPLSLSIQMDWIYALDIEFLQSPGGNYHHYSLDKITKKDGQRERLYSATSKGLKIFDPSTQITRSDHPCASSENTCDKFCFAVPKTHTAESLQRVCGCPYGEKLAENGRSCIDNSKAEPPASFLPCEKIW